MTPDWLSNMSPEVQDFVWRIREDEGMVKTKTGLFVFGRSIAWFFIDETQADACGPYRTKEEACLAAGMYAECEEGKYFNPNSKGETMSISSDALLLYGLNLAELDDFDDFDDQRHGLAGIAEKLGIKVTDSAVEAIDDWFTQRGILELVRTCHSEYPQYFIAAKGYKTTYRGRPVEISSMPDMSRSEIKELSRVGKLLDLKPAFWLASYTDF